MARKNDSSRLAGGLNTSVEHGEQCYHVQTQCSTRGAPVIESLVFQGGQTLVRMTASYEDVAQKLGFNGDDGQHLLELQHADLIRKIRHGMLGGGEPAPASGLDPSQSDEPGVRELLRELSATVDRTRARRAPTKAPAPAQRLPWWRRWAINIRLPF